MPRAGLGEADARSTRWSARAWSSYEPGAIGGSFFGSSGLAFSPSFSSSFFASSFFSSFDSAVLGVFSAAMGRCDELDRDALGRGF